MNPNTKIKAWFEEAIDDLYCTNFWLAAEITKIGYPKLVSPNSYPPTASVGWDDVKRKVMFAFNVAFFETLTKEEFKYIVCHESTHVMNLHIFLFRDELAKLKNKKAGIPEIEDHMAKLNIAADCVVNDSITRLYNLPRLGKLGWSVWVSEGKQSLMELAAKIKMDIAVLAGANPTVSDVAAVVPKDQKIIVPTVPLYGMDLVKLHTEDLAVMDVFYLLPEDLSQYGVGNHQLWRTFFNDDGTMKKGFVDKIKDFIEGNLDNSALSDEEAKILDGMKDDLENSSDKYAMQAGKEAVGKYRPVDGLGKNALNWSRLLYRLTEVKKPRDMWNRSPRKLASVYPDVILPSIEDEEKEEVFIAIDTSGSIDRAAASLFTDVVRGTPKRFKITAITFDTNCYQWDPKSGDDPVGGGGTSFRVIEQYINQKLKKYPKAIFVLTDGGGDVVEPKHPERWCWLLYGSCSDRCIGDMERHNIKDLLK